MAKDSEIRIRLSLISEQFKKELAASVGAVQAGSKQAQTAFGGMGQGAQSAAANIARLAAELYALKQAADAVGAVIGSGIKAEKLNSTLTFATGSAASAADALKFVREEADRVGVSFVDSAEAFGKLAAAAKGTSLEGQATREIFTSIAEASRVMGLSADESRGALTAVQQMISKGTVAAEELRGQLGERLPGAFQIAARAMGVTTQELGKMLEQGEVVADDFLPRFAAELRRSVAEALPGATETFAAQLERLKNLWTDTLNTIAQAGLMDAVADEIEQVSAALGELSASGDLRQMARDFAAAVGLILNLLSGLATFLVEHRQLVEAVAASYLLWRTALFGLKLAEFIASVGNMTAAMLTTSAAATTLATQTAALGRQAALTEAIFLRLRGVFAAGVFLWSADQALTLIDAMRKFNAEQEEGARAATLANDALHLQISLREAYKDTTRLAGEEIAKLTDAEKAAYRERLQAALEYWEAKRQLEVNKIAEGGPNAQVSPEAIQATRAVRLLKEQIGLLKDEASLLEHQDQLIKTIEKDLEEINKGALKRGVDAVKAEITQYEKLRDAMVKAFEDAGNAAAEAAQKAEQLRMKAADIRQSTANKLRDKQIDAGLADGSLTQEGADAIRDQQGREALDQAKSAAAKAYLATQAGQLDKAQEFTEEMERQAARAETLAGSIEDSVLAQRLLEEAGEAAAQAAEKQAAIEEKKAEIEKQRQDELGQKIPEVEATIQTLQQALADLDAKIGSLTKDPNIIKLEADQAALDKLNQQLDQVVRKMSAIKGGDALGFDTGVTDSAGNKVYQEFALGGPITGSGPIGVDSELILAAPGEHMITAREVAAAGGHDAIYRLRRALLAGSLPRFAEGGAITRAMVPVSSTISRAAISTMPMQRASSEPALRPINLTIPNIGTFPVQAKALVAEELRRELRRVALQFGNLR